ncbi:hypothetical protein Micr_00620 [Candidatus Micrarchaeum sp.]|jgi:hypothetical protein|nr:MAG: hypothetical protein BK997_01620 [Candidatus Micrarchaeum sp. ARMAN-1]OJT94615.1 MAG: hypothetical protein JJ59_00715 [Candidatus Micrarchaeum sp. AZ1]OWP53221.1 MAG: hypothetical protein B2I19_04850 [Thermoplasmatales archaeon ARMAN]QRF74092.1 hypothetical protein Micr_00620 [Candidatus Micrarchaeum sp.]
MKDMVFKNKKEDNKGSAEKEESEKFMTLSIISKVANLNGHADMGKTLKSLLLELNQSSKIIRLEEERRMDPDLEKLLQEHKNIVYAGPVAPYRKDVTNNTPFSSIAKDTRISGNMPEFCAIVSETMDYLLSERGIAALTKIDVFEDLMSEASFGKDQEILDSMASGMVKGIARIRKYPTSVSNTEYSHAKLLMQNLLLNSFTSQEMKDKLAEAWRSA